MIVRFIKNRIYDMKLEYKSLFFGIVLVAVSVSVIFLFLGDAETESFYLQSITSNKKILK